jgi:hypothetical protein
MPRTFGAGHPTNRGVDTNTLTETAVATPAQSYARKVTAGALTKQNRAS